jgi:PAS domain S-box-containing protein
VKVLRRNTSVAETLRGMMMLTTLSALVLACLAFAGADLISMRNTTQADLTTLADVIGSNSAAALTFGDHESAAQILEALRARPSIVAARIYTANGAPFVSRGDARVSMSNTAPARGARFTGGVFEVVRPILFRGETIGTIYIAADRREVFVRVRQYALGAVFILIVSVAVAFAISSSLQRILSNPIRDLAGIAERVRQERDYSVRTPIGASPAREIGDLMSAFNEMLAEIESRDEELQRRRADLEEQVAERTGELCAAKDAAERIAEENEALSRRTQMILNTAAEGICELDADGVATFVNLAAARILGYHVEELTGRRLHDVVHADCIHECPVCSTVPNPPARAGHTMLFVARDGRRFPIEYTTSTMQERGGPAGVVITFRDITSRVQVDRLKDEFVSTVSHELRTPLTSVRGALGLLSSGVLGAISDRAKRMLEIAVTNTDRLVRLINDILDLERISSGRVELNRGIASAAELMRDAVDVVQTVADRASVSIACEPDPTLIWVDRDRIVQTLTNLLGNAIKFSPAGASVRLHGCADGETFTFSVEDRGRGIPADKLESVFERFKQVDASDSRDKGGSGLGLAICRSIVTAHGGSIRAESREGEGSSFRFTVPLAAPTSVVAASPQRALFTAAASTDAEAAVLVVEDDSDLARVISTTLEGRGLHTHIVATGEEAIAACRASRPVLIVLDLILPGLDGFGVVDWLRREPRFASLPLLIYSASEVSAADRERLRLGPTKFLIKSCVPLASLPEHVAALLTSEPREVAARA